MTVRIAALVGSLRAGSVTRIASREALAEAERLGAETDLIDLREFDLPMYDPDASDAGDAVALKSRLRDADAVVLGTPMYHGSYSSPIKVAIDYSGFDEFENTTVGLLAVAGGSFPITALEHLRSTMRALDAWVLPHQAAIPNASSTVADGEIVDEDIAERVRTLGRRVVQYANIEPDPLSFEGAHNVKEVEDT
ncbi:Multimeric flavodoxin WrbA [Halanaeroarchaeum sp. HSR-CO]|uniref:NADPH-dependent FMN reductase n=1 Tax=Halanaeroarchaeum sp. HSR-CO TaxID=2866382 RepID=UPI00217DFC57|nr:NAD(P)H-dependent oxidoreductase [Halanaeroarchaeum sp. HSR-CO]UWG48452.1 Multimeric flavodoxin WrbA [Halanaeroarchaeum sp. HSR-CO]